MTSPPSPLESHILHAFIQPSKGARIRVTAHALPTRFTHSQLDCLQHIPHSHLHAHTHTSASFACAAPPPFPPPLFLASGHQLFSPPLLISGHPRPLSWVAFCLSARIARIAASAYRRRQPALHRQRQEAIIGASGSDSANGCSCLVPLFSTQYQRPLHSHPPVSVALLLRPQAAIRPPPSNCEKKKPKAGHARMGAHRQYHQHVLGTRTPQCMDGPWTHTNRSLSHRPFAVGLSACGLCRLALR